MTTSKDLLLAILAMDSYNREYGAGLVVSGAQVGSATFKDHVASSISETTYSNWQSSGFYAAAYDTPYGQVISYRGTDNFSSDPNKGGSDVWKGWVSSVGIPSSQYGLAMQFYQTITGKSVYDGAASSTILTGHSLGGGLAGMVGALSGTETLTFDHAPFGLISILQYAYDHPSQIIDPSTWSSWLKLSQISGIYVDGEIMELARSSVTAGIISQLLYGNLIPGLLASAVESQVSKTELQSYSDPAWETSPDGIANKLHANDLLVLLQFAKDNNLTDWQSIGIPLWNSYFDDTVGSVLGLR